MYLNFSFVNMTNFNSFPTCTFGFILIVSYCIKSNVIGSLLRQKRAPLDENGFGDPISSNFKNWNATLKKAKIIPDILPSEVPHPLTVVYFDDDADFGSLLEHRRFDMPPVDLDWTSHESDYYTAIMTDPDYPDPKHISNGEYLHWMVANIKHALVKKGETLAEYVPPLNKTSSNGVCKGIHRIVFVVYKQLKGTINVPPNLYTSVGQLGDTVTAHNREHFSSKDFATEHNLIPYAANFFTTNLDIV